MARFIRSYAWCQVVLHLGVLGFAVLAQINSLLRLANLDAYVRPLAVVSFLMAIPTFALAEDKNVWKNEFSKCPKWMRIAVAVAMVYGFAVATVTVVFYSPASSFGDNPTFSSAVALFIAPMPVVVLYTLLHDGAERTELRNRVRLSVVFGAVVVFGVVAHYVHLFR